MATHGHCASFFIIPCRISYSTRQPAANTPCYPYDGNWQDGLLRREVPGAQSRCAGLAPYFPPYLYIRVDDTSGLFGPLVARSVPPSSVLARSKRQPVRSMKYGPKNLRSGPVKARSTRSDRRRSPGRRGSTRRSCSRGHRPPPRDLLVPFFLLFSREKMERTTETGLSHNHGAISRLLVVTPMEITAHMILRKSLPLFSSI